MKKMVILVGNSEMRLLVADVLKKQLGAVPCFAYFQILDVLGEVFETEFSLEESKDFPVQITETHLHKFFGKMGKGVHSINPYVGKLLATTGDIINFFVNKIGRHCFGEEFIVRDAVDNFIDAPEGLFVYVDMTMADAKKAKAILQKRCEIVQIGGKEDGYEEGIARFAFDPSEKSWKKSVVKMFDSFNAVKKEKEFKNGKQRNA